MATRSRMQHIDGIKGILCFLIMLGHYWNIIRSCSGPSPFDRDYLEVINSSVFGKTFLVASFWLYAFLVISGYLLSGTGIRSAREFLLKGLGRFLRLYIPILGACCFIFAIQKTVGFHAQETQAYFTNNWFQKYYRRDFVWQDIFIESAKAMFSGSCAFNAPFWVIRDMFLSSLAMYACNLLDHVFKRKTHVLPILYMLCVILADNHVMIACFAGYLLGYYRDSIGTLTENFENFLVIVGVSVGLFWIFRTQNVLPNTFDKIGTYILVHCILLITVNRFEKLRKFFSTKIFLAMGKISFGVYSFHWPITCSVGTIVLLNGLRHNRSEMITYLVAFLVSVIATVVISVVYEATVEKFSTRVVGLLRREQ